MDIQHIVENLQRDEAGTTAAAVLRLAEEHGRVEVKDGKMIVTVPVDHPHWDLIVELPISHRLMVAGYGHGVRSVEFRPGWEA